MNKTLTFATFKKKVLDIAIAHVACHDEKKRAESSLTFQELLTVIKDNSNWCHNHGIFNSEFLLQVPDKELLDAKIYINKKDLVFTTEQNVYLFSSSVAEMWGSSSVAEMWGSSSVAEMWGSSSVAKMWESSSVAKMWESSSVAEMRGSSSVAEMRGSSSVAEMWGSSSVAEMRGSSSVAEMWESSSVAKMWGSSSVAEMRGSSSVAEMRESSSVRKFEYGRNPRIFFQKDAFEIVMVEDGQSIQ